MRCSTPEKDCSVWRITGAGTPIKQAMAVAASAFSKLCGPGMRIWSASQMARRAPFHCHTIFPPSTNAPFSTGCVRLKNATWLLSLPAILKRTGSSMFKTA